MESKRVKYNGNKTGVKQKLEDCYEMSSSAQKGSGRAYTQHPQHWYTDGNLFLQIGDIRFKIHSSRLAADSPFFAALLDQRRCKHKSKPYKYQSEIDQILLFAEDVDGTDLFYLDPEDELSYAPNACEFAALLTAMNTAIEFLFNCPKLQDAWGILKAANFYEMRPYLRFGCRYFIDLFPDSWRTIPVKPSETEHAVECVRLGTQYPDIIGSICRPAFYDLARLPLLSGPTMCTRNGSEGEAQNAAKKTAKRERMKLKKLDAGGLVTLLDLQKRLGLKWIDIFALINVSCTKHENCTQLNDITALARPIREALPYDPIIGIRRILEVLKSLPSTYCQDMIEQVKARLKNEAQTIWKDFGEWIQENDCDTSSQSDVDSDTSSSETESPTPS